jgi:HD-like signal output (HDOD) protein
MNLNDVLAKADRLPPAPAVLPKLLALLNDMDSDPMDIVRLIKVDPSLTAQVLRLSNSVYYGMSTSSTSLDEAVNRIGFREVYKLVAMICSKDMLATKLDKLCIQEGQLWEQSITCGFVMEYLATKMRIDSSNCYTIGLLHALGKILITTHPDFDYDDVFNKVEQEQLSLEKAEHACFGFTMAELAACLLEKWNFPPDICIPIRHQNSPDIAPQYKKQAGLLHLAIWMVASLGLNFGKNSWAIETNPAALEILGISEVDVMAYIPQVHDRLLSIKNLLK